MRYKYVVDKQSRTVKAVGTSKKGTIYNASANCAPDDTFDVQKGINIAKLRVGLQQLRNVNEQMERNFHNLENMAHSLSNRHKRNMEKIIQKCAELEAETKDVDSYKTFVTLVGDAQEWKTMSKDEKIQYLTDYGITV